MPNDRQALRALIARLPVDSSDEQTLSEDAGAATNPIDIDKLPEGIIAGSNLIQLPAGTSPALKSSVALSLLAAQRVASNDPVVTSPAQWLARHNLVLSNLNWRIESGGAVTHQFNSLNTAVHKAIIPFLTAALGGAVAASLIVTALDQLQSMDKDAPWITLFERQSRRFDVSEYQFTVASVVGDKVELKLAAARLDASYGMTQVLFFKLKKQEATFEQANQTLVTEMSLLEDLNGDLRAKLMGLTKSYIRSLPDELLLG